MVKTATVLSPKGFRLTTEAFFPDRLGARIIKQIKIEPFPQEAYCLVERGRIHFHLHVK